MDGITLTRIVDAELKKQGKTRLELCEAIGITSAAYTNWKNGGQPRKEKLLAIEKYLGIDLSDAEKWSAPDDETAALREMLRDRQDLRILLNSAKDVPASSVYALISQIEKMKEDAK